MRQTKIIATVGPATAADEVLDELVAAGTDIFRLNFSHGTHDWHAGAYRRIRNAAGQAGRMVAVLQDLSGPKIRTGPLASGRSIMLEGATELRIATGDFAGSDGRISTSYSGLARSVRPGDRLLVDDGRIELRVEESDGREIRATVIEGGELGEHKGINAPGVTLPAAALTIKDADDLRFGLDLGVDMVALSFVQAAADLERTRQILAGAGSPAVPLIAKLERPEAIARIEEILGACDAVMVARGDLGLELPLERVPRVQREIVREARARGVPVIVATQVLESMRTEPRPTRAEVSDAATAVDEGVDAIMLAGETAVGAFPVRAVRTLDAIIRDAEAVPLPSAVALGAHLPEDDPARAICEAAVTLAESGRAQAIVAVTRAGTTARLLSAFRPPLPIFAATDSEETARRLCLYRGVVPVACALGSLGETGGADVARQLVERGLVPRGVLAVLVSVNPDLTRGDANFLKLLRVE